MIHVSCPSCNAKVVLSGTHSPSSLPPTGGDYDWMETEKTFTCHACQTKIPLRVRIDLETQEVIKLLGKA